MRRPGAREPCQANPDHRTSPDVDHGRPATRSEIQSKSLDYRRGVELGSQPGDFGLGPRDSP